MPVQAQTPAADALRVLAEAGDAVAQFNLGVSYDFGQDVPQDDAEAVRWYRLAADQGHAGAQNSLGFMYATGEGVPQDYVEAVRLYRLAADQGLAEALSNLGLLYENGEGVPQDYVQAHIWTNLAVAQSSGEDRDRRERNRDIIAVVRRRLNPIWSSHRLITAVRARLTSPTTSADNLSAVVTCTTDC